MFKKFVFALAALALFGLSSIQPAAAIVLFSSTIGDVNFPGLTANANVVTGVTAQKVASGETAVTGTATAVTGLASIRACIVSLKIGTAPGVTTSVATYTTTTGTLNLFAWKVTSSSDNTLIAATAAATVGWVCTGA